MVTIIKIPTEQGILYRVCDMFTLHVYLETYSELEATTAQRLMITGKA